MTSPGEMAGERLILRSDISWRITPRAKKNLAVFRKDAWIRKEDPDDAAFDEAFSEPE